MSATRPSKWSVAFALFGLALLTLVMSWGWLRAWWIYPDLTEQQRIESFNDALVARRWRGVTARLDRGGMAVLGRSDIAEVGASQCRRQSECAESVVGGRTGLGCLYVSVEFNCSYAVKTTDGGSATAIVRARSNRGFTIGVTAPGRPKPLEIEEVRLDDDKACARGDGCPSAPAPTSGTAGRSSAAPAPAASAECKGFRAAVAGVDETCLVPGDPTRRDFRDCHNGFCGPFMVALPKGQGLRGSSTADIARLLRDDPRGGSDTFRQEAPQRNVTIDYPLAVGKFEITYDEWEACLADRACTYRPTDPSYPTRGARPVVHVSWLDIDNEFLPWLNRKLGLSGASAYRLLSEAEWEYAARAGSSGKYAVGDLISTDQAQFLASYSVAVGSFPPNGFGLHDMHGNVQEWVQDCYGGEYDTTPADGSAYDPGNCSSRMHRGGSWNDVPVFIRSANRRLSDPKDRVGKGFRVARTLEIR